MHAADERPDARPHAALVRGRGRDRRVRPRRSSRSSAASSRPDQWRAFRLVRGTYGQRQDGRRPDAARQDPAGRSSTRAQLEALADVAERYSRGFGHVTTRQNVQFHFVQLHDVEPAMRRLAEAGLTTREACGNSVRNITACPYAGVARGRGRSTSRRTPRRSRATSCAIRWRALPRKFKIAFEGCPEDHAFTAINDLGWRGARPRADGRRGAASASPSAAAPPSCPRRAACSSSSCPRARSSTSPRRSCASSTACGDYKHKQRNRMKFLIREHGLGRLAGRVRARRSPTSARRAARRCRSTPRTRRSRRRPRDARPGRPGSRRRRRGRRAAELHGPGPAPPDAARSCRCSTTDARALGARRTCARRSRPGYSIVTVTRAARRPHRRAAAPAGRPRRWPTATARCARRTTRTSLLPLGARRGRAGALPRGWPRPAWPGRRRHDRRRRRAARAPSRAGSR